MECYSIACNLGNISGHRKTTTWTLFPEQNATQGTQALVYQQCKSENHKKHQTKRSPLQPLVFFKSGLFCQTSRFPLAGCNDL